MAKSNSYARAHIPLLVTIALGMFLDGLDGTIVNVALPDISESFGMDSSLSSWIVTVYFLVLAGLVLIFGKLCDSGAIKKIIIAGFLVFSLASLACGLSEDIVVLLAARAVQGVGASMLAASSVMLSVKFLPSHMTSFGLGVGLLGSSIGAAIGPALGGVLAETLSWHWVFFINVPVGIVAAVIAHRAIPADTGFDRSAFDYKGSVLLFLSLVTGLYALESFPSHGVTTATVVSLVLFVVLFSVFVLYERRISIPVLNLKVFRSGRFVAVSVSFLIMNACYMGCLYLLPYYMRMELGFDTIMCGLFLLVAAVMTLIFCLKVGKMADMRGNRPFVIAGCFLRVVAPEGLRVRAALVLHLLRQRPGHGAVRGAVRVRVRVRRAAHRRPRPRGVHGGIRVRHGLRSRHRSPGADPVLGGQREEVRGMTIRTSFDRIYRAMTVMEQCVDERQGTMDLTYKEMMYLYLIDLTEDCTVSKLADMINVSLPAVTKRINSLEERGLVQRTRSEGDGRVKTVTLSERGAALSKRMDDLFYPILDRFAERFPQEDVARFCMMLDMLSDDIEGAIRGDAQ